MKKIIILGAGMAGLGAAHKLYENGIESVLYEKNPYVGGHAASFKSMGYIFDDGPHISFTRNERIQKLLAESVNQQYEVIQAAANNYWQGYWIKHPAQCNLHGLPPETIVEILHDFIKKPETPQEQIANYRDWLYASFGKAFAETFPMQYGQKFHTTNADNMTTDWIGVRLYQANLREILYGAITSETPDVHYVDHFRYPSHGGFASFLDLFVRRANLLLDHEIAGIDIRNRTLTFTNGLQIPYDHLISSIPLPELIPMIEGAPSEVLDAAQRLACTSCVLVNVGVDRSDLSTSHWTYYYDRDFVFTRLSFPHMLACQNAPEGCGSIQAEIYFSDKYRPRDRAPQSFIEPVVADLKRCGILQPKDTIVFCEARLIRYANVVFDLDRPKALAKVHAYLEEQGIATCGRYGEWGYHWTDQSFISGENAAQRIVDML